MNKQTREKGPLRQKPGDQAGVIYREWFCHGADCPQIDG
ncbi:hypothetical protein Z947_2187 [Sulfitobacter geojensis]|nr:hypothetical protein Z947_2187 [Sulfitobacter geojensis]